VRVATEILDALFEPSMLRTAQAVALFVRDWCGVTDGRR
jgi:hypothetical protein